MKSIFLISLLVSQLSFAEEPTRWTMECKDIEHFGSLNWRVAQKADEKVEIRASGRKVAELINQMADPIQEAFEIELITDQKNCKFSETDGVFSCYLKSRDAFNVTVKDNSNTILADLEVEEFKASLFTGSRYGYRYHRSSPSQETGHLVEWTMKSADTRRVLTMSHAYFYQGAKECTFTE